VAWSIPAVAWPAANRRLAVVHADWVEPFSASMVQAVTNANVLVETHLFPLTLPIVRGVELACPSLFKNVEWNRWSPQRLTSAIRIDC
jgi:hypothetical protein